MLSLGSRKDSVRDILGICESMARGSTGSAASLDNRCIKADGYSRRNAGFVTVRYYRLILDTLRASPLYAFT
jgi:hypothetical protein